MGIMTRIVRIFKADIHGVMDRLEDKELLLKQYLRDMEAALDEKEARLRKMKTARDLVGQEYAKYNLEIENIEQDLRVAIQKDKDEIARLLIKKRKPLSRLRDDLQSRLDTLEQEMVGFKDCISKQRLQYDQIKHRSTEFLYRVEKNQWEKVHAMYSPGDLCDEVSDEEIELELLQRKEALSLNNP